MLAISSRATTAARRWVVVSTAVATMALGSLSACGGQELEGASVGAATGGGDQAAAEPASPEPSPGGLPDASEAQRSAPADGSGTALLREVRVGRHDGFERVVFEFEGATVPGYRVQWIEPPIVSDGAGTEVDVAGNAFLEVILQPASGVDLSAPELRVVYEGPDRIPLTGRTELVTDLVRTGDFEAVLSWVAGAVRRAPFRVVTLHEPSRVVVDVVNGPPGTDAQVGAAPLVGPSP